MRKKGRKSILLDYSKLDEAYLKEISSEVGALYVRGDNIHKVLEAMKKQKPARRAIAPFNIDWVLAGLAGLLLLAAYFSKHPFKRMAETLGLHKKSLSKRAKNEVEISHDNYSN